MFKFPDKTPWYSILSTCTIHKDFICSLNRARHLLVPGHFLSMQHILDGTTDDSLCNQYSPRAICLGHQCNHFDIPRIGKPLVYCVWLKGFDTLWHFQFELGQQRFLLMYLPPQHPPNGTLNYIEFQVQHISTTFLCYRYEIQSIFGHQAEHQATF